MDLSFREIAHNLSISVGTTFNIYQLFCQTGEVSPKKPRKREESRKLDNYHENYIICMIVSDPTLYLSDITQKVYDVTGVAVSSATICRLLASHGITRKKVKQIALQRNSEYRGAFIANVLLYSRDMFVWVDETGSDKRDLYRKYGYAFRGERAEVHRLVIRGKRVSSIAAISSTGVVDVHMTTESVNGDTFFDFVRGSLIPNMLPYPNPKSIIIMDNCSIHHVGHVAALLEEMGILHLFLPPYSPDLNPIESVFGFIKGYLKEYEYIMHAFPDYKVLLKSAFEQITQDMCNNWITLSGYDYS